MTLPTLINNTKWKQYEVRFAVAQNLFNNAIQDLQVNGILINGTLYGSTGANNSANSCTEKGLCNETFTNIFAQAFIDINAIDPQKAYGKTINYETYKNFTNNNRFYPCIIDDGFLELKNGMSVIFNTSSATAAPIVWFDLDGTSSGPNRAGIDLFAFIVDENGKTCPVGSPLCSLENTAKDSATFDIETTTDYTQSKYCSPTSSEEQNGVTCGYFASVDKDYFKKVMK